MIWQSAVLRNEARALRTITRGMRDEAMEDSNEADGLIGDIDEPQSANWFEQLSIDLDGINWAIWIIQSAITIKEGEIWTKEGEITAKETAIGLKETDVTNNEWSYGVLRLHWAALVCAPGDFACQFEKLLRYTAMMIAYSVWQTSLGELATLQGELWTLATELGTLNGQLEELEEDLEEWKVKRTTLCNKVLPAVQCTVSALHTKAIQLRNEAIVLAATVRNLTRDIEDNAQEYQDKILEADELQKRGWAKCASGGN